MLTGTQSRLSLLLLTIAFGAPTPSTGDDVDLAADIPGLYQFAVEQPVAISDGGRSRILLSCPDLADIIGQEVRLARLILPHIEVSRPTRIEAYAINTAWTAEGVGWDAPWEARGGDFDRTSRGVYTIQPDRDADQPIVLDVTGFVAAVSREERGDYGLLLIPSNAGGAGFDSEFGSDLASLDSIEIVVVCED